MNIYKTVLNAIFTPILFRIIKRIGEKPEYTKNTESQFRKLMLLCKLGVNVNVKDDQGNTLLHYCTWRKSYLGDKIAAFLISQGADPNASNEQGASPFNLLPLPYKDLTKFWRKNFFEYGGRDAIPLADLLSESGADIQHQDKIGHTVLYEAIINEETTLVSRLLQLGAKLPNLIDTRRLLKRQSYEAKAPPLHFAIARENHQLVHLLLDAGADVNQPDNRGLTPLGFATSLSSPNLSIGKLLLLLIERGADVRAKNDCGEGTLLALTKTWYPNNLDVIAKYCIEKGVDLEERDLSGSTVLAYVVRLGDVKTARLLVEAGIKVNAFQGQEGLTALEILASIPTLFTGANGIGNWKDLHEVAELLLQAGASLSQTALDLAKKNGNDKLLSLFQNYNKKMPNTGST